MAEKVEKPALVARDQGDPKNIVKREGAGDGPPPGK